MLYNNQHIITITLAVYLQVHIINGWSRAKNSTHLKKTWYFSQWILENWKSTHTNKAIFIVWVDFQIFIFEKFSYHL